MKQLFLVFFLLIHLTSFSQTNKRLYYQCNIGSNISIPRNFSAVSSYSNSIDYKSNIGMFAEMGINYQLNNKYFLFSGINYAFNKLERNQSWFNNLISTYKSSSQLISIPLELKVGVTKSRQLMVGFGGYIGKIVSNERKINQIIPGDPNSLPNQGGDVVDKYVYRMYSSYGFSISTEYNFEFEKMNLTVMTKFYLRRSNINSNSTMTRNLDYNMQLGIGIKI